MVEDRILRKLTWELHLTPLQEVGCMRRNVWSGVPWSHARGNAVLQATGALAYVVSGLYSHGEVYILDDWLLLWRAGAWKEYWENDARELAALVMSEHKLGGVAVVWEYNGRLRVREFSAPQEAEQNDLLRRMKERAGNWNGDPDSEPPPPRVRKDGPRRGGCFYCPVKARCDAMDRIFSQCDDWASDYHTGPVKGGKQEGESYEAMAATAVRRS
jgi:hypothetical protein